MPQLARRRTPGGRLGFFRFLPLWPLLVALPAIAQEAGDVRCQRDSDIRLIEIRFEQDGGGLPCRVIYRPETQSDTIGTVSWRGIPALEGCSRKVGEISRRLSAEGWQCSRPAGEPVTTAATGAQLPTPVARAPIAVPPGLPAPAPAVRLDEADFDRPATYLVKAELEEPAAQLADMVKRDLSRLDFALDGELQAMIADYGDLNADNHDDAVILITYLSNQPAYRQIVAAYLSDGEAYHLASTRVISGSANSTRDAEVERVDQGVIHLKMRAFEPGDGACCPSGERRLALTLDALELVEVDATASR
jgi:hypothetical protein